jgi:hypothetical protein
MPPVRGHIVLTVNATQANAPVQGRLYAATWSATRGALTAPGVGGQLSDAAAAPIASAAAEAALSFGGGGAASAVITRADGPPAAGVAAFNAASGAIPLGMPAIGIAGAVATAARNAGAADAVAAGAGAAAGTYYGGGTESAVRWAVEAALIATGMAGHHAWDAARDAVPARSPSQFRVRFYNVFNPGGPANVVITHR